MRPPDPRQSFVESVLETPAGAVPRISTALTRADTLGHWRVRWGIRRRHYRVDPGLYAAGSPGAGSPVLVTANYKLTFDVLRSNLTRIDAWILVLDTRGINVWCAAGKGTFSTDELSARVEFARLAALVSHRRIVVPQLAAAGVAAHEVQRSTGFHVVYGPVRAADIPAFLAAGMQAAPAMRQPTFTAWERLVLTPAELVGMWKPTVWILAGILALVVAFSRPLSLQTVVLRFAGYAISYVLAVLGGAVLTPLLLPWLRFRSFAAKGALVGVALGAAWLLPVLAASTQPVSGSVRFPMPAGGAIAVLSLMTALSSFVAMNFTGSTPFTSMSGVEHEMRRWIPLQAAAAGAALVFLLAGALLR